VDVPVSELGRICHYIPTYQFNRSQLVFPDRLIPNTRKLKGRFNKSSATLSHKEDKSLTWTHVDSSINIIQVSKCLRASMGSLI